MFDELGPMTTYAPAFTCERRLWSVGAVDWDASRHWDRRVNALPMLLGVLVATGCATESGSKTTPPATSTSTSPVEAGMGALLIGKVDGDPRTGCIWVVSTQNPAVEIAAKWLRKYKIVGNPYV